MGISPGTAGGSAHLAARTGRKRRRAGKLGAEWGGGGGDLFHGLVIMEEQTRAGFNELAFDDKQGAEQVYLRAQRNLDEVVLVDHTTHVGKDQSTVVEGDQSTVVSGTQW